MMWPSIAGMLAVSLVAAGSPRLARQCGPIMPAWFWRWPRPSRALLAPPPRRRLAPAVSLLAMIDVMAGPSVVQSNNTDAVQDSAGTAAVQGADLAAR
jgi:hypothetical protein